MKTSLLAVVLLLAPFALTAQDTVRHGPKPNPDNPNPHPQETDQSQPHIVPSHFVTVTFQGRATTLSVEDLLALPQVTVHVHNAHRNTDEVYSGPLVSDVLARGGLAPSKENDSLVLHSTVIATATDKYFVVYSAAEVEPTFSTGKVIVAVMKSGLPDADGGGIQLINTADAKPARWVHGLTTLAVMSVAQNQ